MAAHYSILAWEIPWREEPGGLQSRGPKRIAHGRAPEHMDATHTHMRLILLIHFL